MNAERSIALLRGDITQIAVDAIVNAANSSLLGGGGVDGAIHRAGGPIILEQCRAINGCATGNAVITDAGRLPAGYVIHAVGPVWRGGREGEADLLASAYRQALHLAEEHTLTSLAFPSISTGAYGYPIVEASRIALETTIAHMRGDGSLRRVIFVLFSDSDLVVYRAALAALLPDTAAARPQDPAGGQA